MSAGGYLVGTSRFSSSNQFSAMTSEDPPTAGSRIMRNVRPSDDTS